LKTELLTLNVTCPSYATVAEPNGDAELFSHGTKNVYDREVLMYVGAKEWYNEYNFPGFYPTFEQCNFITGYHLTTSSRDDNSGMYDRNNTMSSYGLIKKIPGMKLYMPNNYALYRS